MRRTARGHASRCAARGVALLAMAYVLTASAVAKAACDSAAITPRGTDREQVFAEGRGYATSSRYAEARAMFGWILERNPSDWEVQLAWARVDAWDGCFESAQVRFRAVLEHYPRDVEARSGLADVLVWTGHRAQALAVIEDGLSLEPTAAELWWRRARLALRDGDRPLAITAADRAEAFSPDDLGIREFRDRLYRGELRAGGRVDLFPSHYANLYTAELQALQSWRRFVLLAQAQLIERAGGDAPETIVDGLYGFEASYQTSTGPAFGLGLGFGAPANPVPQLQAKAFFSTPIAGAWSGAFAYSFWKYAAEKSVHIFAPAIGYAVSDDVQLELRLWTSYLVIQPPSAASRPADTAIASAAGIRARWRALSKLTLTASYTYGPQLDRAATGYQILNVKSHILAITGDWLLHRYLGLSGMVGFEHRTSDNGVVIPIFTSEIASYLRW